MRFSLLLACLALPLLEIALLIKAGQSLGFWGVLLLLVASSALGITVIRRWGFSMAARLSEAMEKGEPPAGPALDGALQVLAGLLLVFPGLMTDALGLLLLVPPVRRLVASAFARQVSGGFEATHERPAGSGDGVVIEGEFERLDERDTGTRDRTR